mgnify:CR=1 FL=1
MITILSPAKNLDFKTDSDLDAYSIPEHLDDSRILINELRQLNTKDIKKLMKVSDDIANVNFERNLAWKTPFTVDNAKHAIMAFKGQVYIGLDAGSFTGEDHVFAQNHLRILSGLYGILKPLDLIQAYRLEMGTKLKNKKGKNLYEFWGNKITESINTELTKQKDKVLINLASNEYFKAIKSKKVNGEIITPVFKEQKGNDFKVITVYAKTARGLMSKFIIQNKIDNPDDIKAFDLDGYLFNKDLSVETEWVFTR